MLLEIDSVVAAINVAMATIIHTTMHVDEHFC